MPPNNAFCAEIKRPATNDDGQPDTRVFQVFVTAPDLEKAARTIQGLLADGDQISHIQNHGQVETLIPREW